MADPRVTKLAQVLVHYSLALQPGEKFVIVTGPAAEPLNLAVYKEAILAGAHVIVQQPIPGSNEIFFKYASDEQLEYVSPFQEFVMDNMDAYLSIGATVNTRSLSGVDPKRQSRASKASAPLFAKVMQRFADGSLKWCGTRFPTHASAQEADMSLSEYEDFVYSAGLLHLDDPVAAWKAVGEQQQKLVDWLTGRDKAVLKGENIDLTLSIKGRNFVKACGRENFPDGEIFTSPVETSVNGWVRFGYPAIYGGREVTNIELWFEDGKIVKETASKGEELLTALLNTDDGSRILGEWGIGTNYGINRFTKDMLFDEKMGGTIHLAVGAGFPECGSQNKSGVHWDMLCDMADSEITVDGDLFYRNGHPVVG
ncbi:MAG: aminopeptidase [Chloroflexi bacterium]|nr:aminopeptidase [Chloroflexota bacterium]